MNLIWNELGNSNWLDLIGWMLIHSVWQFAAIGVLFFVVRAMLQRMPPVRAASASYQWACFCLFAMTAAPMVTLLIIENQPSNRISTQTESVTNRIVESNVLMADSNMIIDWDSASAAQDLTEGTGGTFCDRSCVSRQQAIEFDDGTY